MSGGYALPAGYALPDQPQCGTLRFVLERAAEEGCFEKIMTATDEAGQTALIAAMAREEYGAMHVILDTAAAQGCYKKVASKDTWLKIAAMRACTRNKRVLDCIPEKLKNDKDIWLSFVSTDGSLLEAAPLDIKANKEVVRAAVLNDPTALRFAAESLRNSLSLILEAEFAGKDVKVTGTDLGGNKLAELWIEIGALGSALRECIFEQIVANADCSVVAKHQLEFVVGEASKKVAEANMTVSEMFEQPALYVVMYSVGAHIEYFARGSRQWLKTQVIRVHSDGSIEPGIKPGLRVSWADQFWQVRSYAPSEGGRCGKS